MIILCLPINSDTGSYITLHVQVVCGNKGDIPGTLIYQPMSAHYGGKIAVNPTQVNLRPGGYESFNLSFSSNRTGDFTETVKFLVEESLEVISLLIKYAISSTFSSAHA